MGLIKEVENSQSKELEKGLRKMHCLCVPDGNTCPLNVIVLAPSEMRLDQGPAWMVSWHVHSFVTCIRVHIEVVELILSSQSSTQPCTIASHEDMWYRW